MLILQWWKHFTGSYVRFLQIKVNRQRSGEGNYGQIKAHSADFFYILSALCDITAYLVPEIGCSFRECWIGIELYTSVSAGCNVYVTLKNI